MHSVFANGPDIEFLEIRDILVNHSGISLLNFAFSTKMPENNTNC